MMYSLLASSSLDTQTSSQTLDSSSQAFSGQTIGSGLKHNVRRIKTKTTHGGGGCVTHLPSTNSALPAATSCAGGAKSVNEIEQPSAWVRQQTTSFSNMPVDGAMQCFSNDCALFPHLSSFKGVKESCMEILTLQMSGRFADAFSMQTVLKKER